MSTDTEIKTVCERIDESEYSMALQDFDYCKGYLAGWNAHHEKDYPAHALVNESGRKSGKYIRKCRRRMQLKAALAEPKLTKGPGGR